MLKRQGLTLAVLLIATTGCNWVNRPIVYETARETPPLEVPNNLIAPSPNPAAQIPPAGDATEAAYDATPPPLSGGVSAPANTGPTELRIEDTSASAWRRVGAALDDSNCCEIVGRDEAAMTYDLEVANAGNRPGFFRRVFGGKGARTAMTVRIKAVGEVSEVLVVDASGEVRKDALASRVLSAIDASLE